MFSTDCRKVNEVTNDLDPMIFNQLQEFRHRLYGLLGNGRDAMFDLMDAVLASASITSFVSLSQSPVFRRQWSSTYAALQASQLPQTGTERVRRRCKTAAFQQQWAVVSRWGTATVA